jgi:hypothetical protein
MAITWKKIAFAESLHAAVTVTSPIAVTGQALSHVDTDGNKHVPANSTTNSGKVLTASGTAGTYTWETPATGGDITTDTAWVAAGDLIVGTGTDTASILTKGATGKVLTAGASALSWETPTGGTGGNLDNGLSDSTFGGVSPIDCGGAI